MDVILLNNWQTLTLLIAAWVATVVTIYLIVVGKIEV